MKYPVGTTITINGRKDVLEMLRKELPVGTTGIYRCDKLEYKVVVISKEEGKFQNIFSGEGGLWCGDANDGTFTVLSYPEGTPNVNKNQEVLYAIWADGTWIWGYYSCHSTDVKVNGNQFVMAFNSYERAKAYRDQYECWKRHEIYVIKDVTDRTKLGNSYKVSGPVTEALPQKVELEMKVFIVAASSRVQGENGKVVETTLIKPEVRSYPQDSDEVVIRKELQSEAEKHASNPAPGTILTFVGAVAGTEK